MDIDQVKQTVLYKTLAKAVRKQDHEERARACCRWCRKVRGQNSTSRDWAARSFGIRRRKVSRIGTN